MLTFAPAMGNARNSKSNLSTMLAQYEQRDFVHNPSYILFSFSFCFNINE